MRKIFAPTAALGLLLCVPLCAQQAATAQQAKPANTQSEHASRFLWSSSLDLSLLIGHPPADDSAITKAELKQLHEIESNRTQEQASAAKADDIEQDIFIYRDIFGSAFTPQNLPLLAALSTDVHHEESVATSSLKKEFARPRPYQLDHMLHPICKLTTEPNSYPSGHALSGYLLAYTMAYIAPEKKDQILTRASEYARNRMVCGVHYASDLEASRSLAAVMFGAMLSNPSFRQRLSEARQEFQTRLASSSAR